MGDIPSLNGIRALAVIIVLVSHAGYGDVVPGGFGVTVFFFLSGYLITTLLLREFSNKKLLDIKKFYIRRFFRLTPPLIVTLAVVYLAVYLGIAEGGITLSGAISQIFYFANYFAIYFQKENSIPSGTGILWSLAVEEHFYFIYPLFLAFLLKLKNNYGIILTLSLICLLVLLWRYYLAVQPDFSYERTYYATDTRIDSILFGCLLAVSFNPIQFNGDNSQLTLKQWLLLILSVLVLLITFLCRDLIFRETLRYTLQGLALMPLFYFAVSRYKHWLFSCLSISSIQKIGIYSYSIYLIHFFVINLISKGIYQEVSPFYLFAFSAAISTFYAFLMHKYIEKYFYKIRKRYA